MAGRPTLYTDEMHQSAIDYVEGGYEKENHPFPSVVGMAVTLKVAKSTLYKWESDNRSGEMGSFSDTLDQCQDYQELKVMNGSIKNEFNSTISKLVLANFGYHDKQDNTLANPHGGPVQVQEVQRIVVDPKNTNS